MDQNPEPTILLRRHAETFIPKALRDFTGEFLATEASSGLLLLAAAVMAVVWVNSPWADSYEDLWSTPITADLGLVQFSHDLRHVVNDGLMTLFFFVVGLEIKRELTHGELSGARLAMFPLIAALGGMALPAVLYTAINLGGAGGAGWGIPMATDIAFAIGALSLLGRRMPRAGKVFLLALAVVDDLGAIVIIALFYSHGVQISYVAATALLVLLMAAMNVRGVRSVAWYSVAGVAAWVTLEQSGVHPAIIGAVLGLLSPALPFFKPTSVTPAIAGLMNELSEGETAQSSHDSVFSQAEDLASGGQSPLDRLERAVHPWANYLVLPIFGLANAGVDLSPDAMRVAASSKITFGIVAGLVLGKTVGITGLSYLACRLKLCELPAGLLWREVGGIGLLAGIGFTVSLFVANLAFPEPELLAQAKIGIMAASVLAGLLGFGYLRCLKQRSGPESHEHPS